NIKEFVQLYREPIVTYCITPNNAPQADENYGMRGRGASRRPIQWDEDIYSSSKDSDMILNTINGLFSKFYAPERVRILKDGIKVKMNDCVSYKVAISNGEMKFYLTVPER